MSGTHVPRKVTKSTKLQGARRSPELALRSTGFRAPENLNVPALRLKFQDYNDNGIYCTDLSRDTLNSKFPTDIMQGNL